MALSLPELVGQGLCVPAHPLSRKTSVVVAWYLTHLLCLGCAVQVQQLKASIDLLQLQGPQQEQPDLTVSTLSSLLASLSGLQSRQQHYQQQQQWQSGLMPPPRAPLQSHNQQQQQWSGSLPPSSPLDKVTAALQAALDAATSRSRPAAPQAADSGGASSRRSSLSPWPPNVAAVAASLPELSAEGSWVSGACASALLDGVQAASPCTPRQMSLLQVHSPGVLCCCCCCACAGHPEQAA